MRRVLVLLLCVCSIGVLVGCAPVRFNERARLADPVMNFGTDPLQAELDGHVFSPREASVGGFSPSGAGGCGCN